MEGWCQLSTELLHPRGDVYCVGGAMCEGVLLMSSLRGWEVI